MQFKVDLRFSAVSAQNEPPSFSKQQSYKRFKRPDGWILTISHMYPANGARLPPLQYTLADPAPHVYLIRLISPDYGDAFNVIKLTNRGPVELFNLNQVVTVSTTRNSPGEYPPYTLKIVSFNSLPIRNIIVSALEINAYSKTNSNSGEYVQTGINESCSICHECGSVSDVWVVTPCQHVYHKACLKKWFQTGHFSCPLCRTPMTMRECDRCHAPTQAQLASLCPPLKHSQIQSVPNAVFNNSSKAVILNSQGRIHNQLQGGKQAGTSKRKPAQKRSVGSPRGRGAAKKGVRSRSRA